MPRYELKKTIEVNKLNKRTGIPTGEPPTQVPFGAVIEDPELDYNFGKFTFLGERYRCASDILKAAMESKPIDESASAGSAAPGEAGPPAAEEPGLTWERLKSSRGRAERAKVPGGWLVTISTETAIGATFYPDAKHHWDGRSLP